MRCDNYIYSFMEEFAHITSYEQQLLKINFFKWSRLNSASAQDEDREVIRGRRGVSSTFGWRPKRDPGRRQVPINLYFRLHDNAVEVKCTRRFRPYEWEASVHSDYEWASGGQTVSRSGRTNFCFNSLLHSPNLKPSQTGVRVLWGANFSFVFTSIFS